MILTAQQLNIISSYIQITTVAAEFDVWMLQLPQSMLLSNSNKMTLQTTGFFFILMRSLIIL